MGLILVRARWVMEQALFPVFTAYRNIAGFSTYNHLGTITKDFTSFSIEAGIHCSFNTTPANVWEGFNFVCNFNETFRAGEQFTFKVSAKAVAINTNIQEIDNIRELFNLLWSVELYFVAVDMGDNFASFYFGLDDFKNVNTIVYGDTWSFNPKARCDYTFTKTSVYRVGEQNSVLTTFNVVIVSNEQTQALTRVHHCMVKSEFDFYRHCHIPLFVSMG